MDKSFAQRPMLFTSGSSSYTMEDLTSARLPRSSSTDDPIILVLYRVSPDQDAFLGSAGPYDDDWDVGSDAERSGGL